MSLGRIVRSSASFVTNIGSLVQPSTAQGGKWCASRGGHGDCVGVWTLRCQDRGTAARGVGGRIADVLVKQMRTTSFSMRGSGIWSTGFSVRKESLGALDGGVANYEPWRRTIRNLTNILHDNLFANAYTELFLDSIVTSQRMEGLLSKATLQLDFPTTFLFDRQLKEVAMMISLREVRQAERDLFFATDYGYDHHSDLEGRMQTCLSSLNRDLTLLVNELRAQSVWNNVVVLSGSEFGRSLASNGGGSEHGWAGNHFVAGGAVKGGQVLNRFPESFLSSGHGRLVPEVPWENMLVPVAQWLGVDADSLATTFPNLHNFGSEHIIPMDVMFSA